MCKQSPFSNFVDLKGFLARKAPLLPGRGPEFQALEDESRNRLLLTTIVYYEVNHVLNMFRYLPLGVIVPALFNLYSFALPRIYSFLSFVHWLDTAESSARLSQMVPKDLYYNHKALSLYIVDNIPGLTILSFVRLSSLFKGLTTVGELVGKIASLNIGQGTPIAYTGKVVTNADWEQAVVDVFKRLENGDSVCLNAPTGTGKTRTFPQLCLGRRIGSGVVKRLLIAMPRNILCQECPIPGHLWKRQGVVATDANFVVATYGHLYEVVRNGGAEALLQDTLVLFDEAHEADPEAVWLYRHLRTYGPVVLMSATPDTSKYEADIPMVVADIKKQYGVARYQVTGKTEIDLFLYLQSRGLIRGRVLIQHPSRRMCDKIATTLSSRGFRCKAVSRHDRALPQDPTWHIAITQVGDAGLNIPGVTMVIDSGLQIVSDRGEIRMKGVDSATMIQRSGRTGRFCHGVYFLTGLVDDSPVVKYPSMDKCLRGDPLMTDVGLAVDLDRRPPTDSVALPGDVFARMPRHQYARREIESLALLHHLRVVNGVREGDKLYQDTTRGVRLEDSTYFLESVLNMPYSDLWPFDDIERTYQIVTPYYTVGGIKTPGSPAFVKGRLTVGTVPRMKAYKADHGPMFSIKPFLIDTEYEGPTYTLSDFFATKDDIQDLTDPSKTGVSDLAYSRADDDDLGDSAKVASGI